MKMQPLCSMGVLSQPFANLYHRKFKEPTAKTLKKILERIQ